MNTRPILLPERVRIIEHPFAWIPFRLLSEGYLSKMRNLGRELYLLLATAADRRGVSFYGEKRICEILGMNEDELHRGRQNLIDLDLLVYDGKTYQLLSLPYYCGRRQLEQVSTSTSHQEWKQKNAIDHGQKDRQLPKEARMILRQLFGENNF